MKYEDWNIHRAMEILSRLIDILRDNGMENEEIIEALNEDYDIDLTSEEIHFLGLDEEEE